MILIISKNDVVFDERSFNGVWCKLSYSNHPKGCPNYGKKKTCPPFTEKYYKKIDPPYFLIIQEFDIESHAKKMKKAHPSWSESQCRNLLYWQKGVVKKSKEKAYDFAKSLGNEFIVLEVPEANGVHVFQTCRNVCVTIEPNPKKIIRKVMIVGKRI